MSASEDSPSSETTLLKKAFFFTGLACCSQFLVVGAIGVIRGYSVQSWAPHWVMLIGILLMIPFSRKNNLVSYFTSGLLILTSLVSIFQGQHETKGDEWYDSGQYKDAITEYRKEIDTWYLRLRFNHNEDQSLFGLAQCYSQLGQFEKARETYTTLAAISQGYYRGRAEKELSVLDANLTKVDEYTRQITEASDHSQKAALLFDLALVYRRLNCSEKAIEQYERIQLLEVREVQKQQAQRFAEKIR